MAGRTFIVFDTETTGIETVPAKKLATPSSISVRGSEVIQVGGIIAGNDMIPHRLFCYYCDAVAAESPVEALDVHGISLQESRKYVLGQFLPEILTRNLPEFFQDDTFFLGYNIDFDMSMVVQALSNTSVDFKWKKFVGTILPRHGRYSVNVADYVRSGSHYVKLTTFEEGLKEARSAFFQQYASNLSVETNCLALLERSWKQAHNSFFDALNTYLLWRERVWGKKLL